MTSDCITYLVRILIKNIGAITFGVIVGCILTSSLVVLNQSKSEHWVNRNVPVFREETHSVDVTVANKLSKEIRVLCWVLTTSQNHQTRAQTIKDTWGRRCNKLLFISNATDKVLGSIGFSPPHPYEENHGTLWFKSKQALEYIHKNYLNDYDWFLKADDDTYVIVENLRYLLHRYSPEHPVYFGYPFQKNMGELGAPKGQMQIYPAGGAGYAMSREALSRVVGRGFVDEKVCGANTLAAEDAHIGFCMGRVNVSAIDSRDSAGRGTFFPFEPFSFLVPNPVVDPNYWFEKLKVFNLEGPNCCSDHAVTFHYVKPVDMHVYEYFIYSLHPYGIVKYPQTLNRTLTEEEMVKIF